MGAGVRPGRRAAAVVAAGATLATLVVAPSRAQPAGPPAATSTASEQSVPPVDDGATATPSPATTSPTATSTPVEQATETPTRVPAGSDVGPNTDGSTSADGTDGTGGDDPSTSGRTVLTEAMPGGIEELADEPDSGVEGFATFDDAPEFWTGEGSPFRVQELESAQDPEEPGDDPRRITGTMAQVCGSNDARANRSGRRRVRDFVLRTWPAVQSVGGFACREINSGTAECDGTWRPAYSTCWSTHAAGRALDVMVGGELNSPTAQGIALGDRIVNWLIARRGGYNGYYARTMGVMQILWHDRCWDPANFSSDRHVTRVADMRRCGIANHDNHPHLTLTNDGADGATSWFRTSNGVIDDVLRLDRSSRTVDAIRVRSSGVTSRLAITQWSRDWTHLLSSVDLDGDRRQDDLLLYNTTTGRYSMLAMVHGVALGIRSGWWSPGWDELAAGDFNGNGAVDDLVLLRNDDRRYHVTHVGRDGVTTRLRRAHFNRRWSHLKGADLDADGVRDDLLLYNRSTGEFSMLDLSRGSRPDGIRRGQWWAGWDAVVPGDYDGNGRRDDLVLYRQSDGRHNLTHVGRNGRTDQRHSGYFGRRWTDLVSADLDGDRRLDDLLLFNDRTGAFSMQRMTAGGEQGIRAGTWTGGWTALTTGDYG